MQGTNQNHIKAVDREVREEEINARTEKGKRKRKVKCITVLMPDEHTTSTPYHLQCNTEE